MSDPSAGAPQCACCKGIETATPARVENPPGQAAITYRAGHHSQFLASMQARLSSTDYPALAALGSREVSDFTIALTDALASSLDVLSFYTERFANEHYLRTASERLSVIELARLIGYQAAPGVAASTHLAFTLLSVPGAPALPITIPVGTRVQSVPGQDEQAQTFETVAAAPARAEWNALAVQQSVVRTPVAGDTRLWLAGTASGLNPGDMIVILAGAAGSVPASAHWEARILTRVTAHAARNLTELRWQPALGQSKAFAIPADERTHVFALRKRTAAFGATAADWRALSDEAKAAYIGLASPVSLARPGDMHEWPDFSVLAPVYPEQRQGNDTILHAEAIAIEHTAIKSDTLLAASITIGTGRRAPLVRSPDRIDISPANPAATAGGWALLSVPGYTELYRISEVGTGSRAEYLMSGQTTRIRLSGPLPGGRLPAAFEHAVRGLSVYLESEEVTPAGIPLAYPAYGENLPLASHAEGIQPGQALALAGPRARITIARAGRGTTLHGDDGSRRALAEGDWLMLTAAPVRLVGGTPHYLEPEAFGATIGNHAISLRLAVEDRDSLTGTIEIHGDGIALAEALADDPAVAEIVWLDDGDTAFTHDRDRSHVRLADPTQHVYDRRMLRINANVAPVTHGESVEAIAGNGDGSVAGQQFALTQAPLTFVSASTPSGRRSTLEVRVNDVLWSEQPTLFRSAADARVFETSRNDAAVTTLRFGDGIEGARLPSGMSNIRVRYRKGLGVAGNVAAGKLTTLLSRPLGVSEAVNPVAASGGEDAETMDRARQNAPLTVLTLDRAVSIADYANFARAFAGIDKAHALWIPAGPAYGVLLTIAGVDGVAVPESSDTYRHLRDALRSQGDPLVPLRLLNYRDVRFRCGLAVKVLATHETLPVLAAVDAALRKHFSFGARRFGQSVSVDEVAATAQSVSGVEAVHVTRLQRSDAGVPFSPRLFAMLPVASLTLLPEAAELLTLADEAVELEALP